MVELTELTNKELADGVIPIGLPKVIATLFDGVEFEDEIARRREQESFYSQLLKSAPQCANAYARGPTESFALPSEVPEGVDASGEPVAKECRRTMIYTPIQYYTRQAQERKKARTL